MTHPLPESPDIAELPETPRGQDSIQMFITMVFFNGFPSEGRDDGISSAIQPVGHDWNRVGEWNGSKENVTNAGKVSQLIDEIAAASQEQAQGIDQINKAISEMDKVTQQTSATAEESASASEQMNAQAEQMKSFVADLRVIVTGEKS